MTEPIDDFFVDRAEVAAPCRRRAAVRRRRRRPGRAARAVRRAGTEPSPRLRRALAPVRGARLLHDRLGGPRGQRSRRDGHPHRRPCPAALPVGRLLRRPRGQVPRDGSRSAFVAGRRSGTRRAARPRRRRRRADGWRAAQGVRPPEAQHHPADVDHRVAPSARGRAGLCARARPPTDVLEPRGRATPSSCALSATRPQPLDGAGRVQCRGLDPRTATSPRRSSSSARTTASASARRRRPGGCSARAGGPAFDTWRADGADLVAQLRRRAAAVGLRARDPQPGVLHLARSVCWATRAPTSSAPTGQRREIAADGGPRPAARDRRIAVERAWPTPRESSSGTSRSAARCLAAEWRPAGPRDAPTLMAARPQAPPRAARAEAVRRPPPAVSARARLRREACPRTEPPGTLAHASTPLSTAWPAGPRRGRLRRGRGPQGRRLRRDPRPPRALRRGARLRHAPR